MKPRRKMLLMGSFVGLASVASLSAQADEKGEKILREAFRKLHQAQSLTAELTTERAITGQPSVPGTGSIVLKKPNYLNVTVSLKAGARTVKETFVSDGTNYFTYNEGARNYMRQPTAKKPTEFGGEWEGEVDAFFGGEANADKVKADFAGTESVDGISCDLVRVTTKPDPGNRVLTYAIGQKDHLIHRTSWTTKLNDQIKLTQTNQLHKIQLNGAAPTTAFAFVPPKNVTLYDPAEQLRKMEEKLVAVGEEAPAFEVTDPQTSHRVSLVNVRDGRKAVLVNFWFYN